MSTIAHGAHGAGHAAPHVHRDYIGAKMGMWLFLYTEVLLFGGLFLLFGIYVAEYTEGFVHTSGKLNFLLGSVNTVVLLISSLTMGLALTSIKMNNPGRAKLFLYLTMLLAITFLAIKMVEWEPKLSHGIYPGSPELIEMGKKTDDPNAARGHDDHPYPKAEFLFFNLYYVMTGLHGFHVLIGIALMLWVGRLLAKREVDSKDFVKLENVGLYWDLVHLVWVFLFPLFYLISVRHM